MSEPGDPPDPPDPVDPPGPDPIDPNDPNAPDPTFPAEPEAPPPPIAPPTDDDLREAVGVARREKPDKPRAASRIDDGDRDTRDDDLADLPPLTAEQQARRRRLWLTLAFSTVIGLIIVAFVFIGRSNASRYYFQCGAEKITAEHGRGFPPWGTRELDGPEWAPIAIPPQAECQTRETEEPSELAGWFLDALIDQARAKLTAREVTAVDDAEKQLRQAYLLARDPKRVDQRNEIDRLLGDVQYWRGIAKVKSANAALADAAKLFDEAAARKPVKVTTSAAWADYARKLVDDLELGPDALRPAMPLGATPPPAREPIPQGVALPVEPAIDANMGAPITPPDAGVPSGGVLL
jgi:hypothetical protein